MAGKGTLTEWRGVNALEKILIETKHVLPFINKADKRVTFDGELEVYESEEFLGTTGYPFEAIPVQLKSKSHKRTSKNMISGTIERKHLINYRNKGGCIHFIIYIDDGGQPQVFYNALSPADINESLSASDKDPCQFNFRLFPENNDEIILLLRTFYTDCKKQTRDEKSVYVRDKLDDTKTEEISSFELTFHGTSEDPFLSLFSNPTTVYAKPKIGLPAPYEKVWVHELSCNDETEVWFDNKKYYDNVQQVKTKNGELIRIGKGIELHKNINFSFCSAGTLTERIHDLQFVLDILKNPGRRIRLGEDIEFENLYVCDDSKQDLDEILCYLREIQDTLKYFGVNSDLDYDTMQEIDFTRIDNLVAIKNGARFETHPYPDMNFDILDMSIANLRLALHVKKDDDGYSYEDFFKMAGERDVIVSSGGVENEASRFILLSKECFVKYDNVNISFIAESIISKKYAPLYADKVWRLLQKALAAYDEHKDHSDILDFAIIISKWLVDNSESIPMFTLDYLQAVKRKNGKFADEEINLLTSIKSQSGMSDNVILVVCILLESNLEAMHIWNNFSDEQKKAIEAMPIFHLWKMSSVDKQRILPA